MKSEISRVLVKVLKEKDLVLSEKEIEDKIEIPPSSELGDYALPCFFLAAKLRENPVKIANDLRNKIEREKGFEKIEVKGAYLNFFIDKRSFIQKTIKEVLDKKEKYGSSDIGKDKKMMVEHTSINPNASPHVGRSRNAFIGDSLVKVLRFLNHNVEVHYLVNDVSKQIAMLVYGKADNLKFEAMLKKYISVAAKVKKSKKSEKEVFGLLYKFEHNDKETIKRFKKITKIAVDGQTKILRNLGIRYDKFDYESDYITESQKVLENLKKTGKIFNDDGCWVLDLKGTKIEGQMKSPVLVLTRSDGTGLYPLRDIAYTLDKISKTKENIVVLGEDQKLYFQQIVEALKLLKSPYPKAVHYSFILLSEKGKSRKMSTRKGDVVLLEDFVGDAIKKAKKEILKRKTKGDAKKIAIAAVKYAVLKISPNKSINFNLGDALSFEGDTGPYLLYSYARACSILRKSKNKTRKFFNIKEISDKEFQLVKNLSEFPEMVLNSYKNLNPSIIANYSYDLAQSFNEFYHSCKVIGDENENFRIFLVESFKIVLKNSLNLLGIETIKKM
ncbi:arginine--tRNA ligase [Candidatus Pacearchaeota archaeon]|nr:arginine--tRNA ligase [Candidatus Pacearchaeota archaeon]